MSIFFFLWIVFHVGVKGFSPSADQKPKPLLNVLLFPLGSLHVMHGKQSVMTLWFRQTKQWTRGQKCSSWLLQHGSLRWGDHSLRPGRCLSTLMFQHRGSKDSYRPRIFPCIACRPSEVHPIQLFASPPFPCLCWNVAVCDFLCPLVSSVSWQLHCQPEQLLLHQRQRPALLQEPQEPVSLSRLTFWRVQCCVLLFCRAPSYLI